MLIFKRKFTCLLQNTKFLSSISLRLPFTTALSLLLLLLLLQCAQGFCAEFMGLWRASALMITASGWWDQGSGSSIADGDAPSREMFQSRSLWAKLRAEESNQVVVMALSNRSSNKAQEVMTNYKHCSEGEIQGFLHCQLCFQPSYRYLLGLVVFEKKGA